jgi:hypothetical protein
MYSVPEEGAHDNWFWAGELSDAFVSVNAPTLSLAMASDCLLNLCYAKKVNNGGGVSHYSITDIPGGVAGNSMTNALAADIHWLPPLGTNRLARTFLWGIPIDAISGGVWDPTYSAVVEDFITSMVTPLSLDSGGEATFVGWTKKTDDITILAAGELLPKPAGFTRRTVPLT